MPIRRRRSKRAPNIRKRTVRHRTSKRIQMPMDIAYDRNTITAFTESMTRPPQISYEESNRTILPESCDGSNRMSQLLNEKKLAVQYLSQLKTVVKRNTGFCVAWPQDHFSMVVVARRLSGKSTLINKLVEEHLVSKRMDIPSRKLIKSGMQFFERKVLFKPTAYRDPSLNLSSFDDVFTTRAELESFVTKYYNAKDDDVFESTLVVMDDVSTWLDSQSHSLVHWFITVNRHFNCSIITVAHNIKNAGPTIRNNASEWILFRCKLDEELKKIEEAFGTSFNEFYDAVDWTVDYNFLYMTLRKGPVTWFFEGRPREGVPKTKRTMNFNEQDVSVNMKYLGKDTLPITSPLAFVCPQ